MVLQLVHTSVQISLPLGFHDAADPMAAETQEVSMLRGASGKPS